MRARPVIESVTENSFNPDKVRENFPILEIEVRGKPLVYLDNAATTQKPSRVIEAMTRYYQTTNANVHRGVHFLSERATFAYEKSRGIVKRFLNAADPREIVFVRGATEGINLVASGLCHSRFRPGDVILVSMLEHHSNIVPWQLAAERSGAKVKPIPILEDGTLDMERFEELLDEKVRLVAITGLSNALGTIPPVKDIIRKSHAAGALVLLDAAQAVAHREIDVKELDCDFLVFSGHKVYGPTGIGVLYGKGDLLADLPPYQGGGDMIRTVSFEGTTYQDPPHRFEAGTPAIAEAIGLGEALEFFQEIGIQSVANYEAKLFDYALQKIQEIPGVEKVGKTTQSAAVISFSLDNVHPHDIATILDRSGVAIRAGHHCAQPIMEFYGVPATSRLSFAMYNTLEEVDIFIEALNQCREMFQ